MKNVIESVVNQLATLPDLKYVDEDWGQLDYYSPNFPVQWPCVLVDVSSARHSNIGMDRQQSPANRQMAEYTLTVKIANQKLTNTSARAPQTQKDQARSIWTNIENIHALIQGFSPTQMCGKLMRTGLNRVEREDGIQEYHVMYSGTINDV